MVESLISFKGSKDGIYVFIKDGEFSVIKKQLEYRLKNSRSFFDGSKVINFKGKELTSHEEKELKTIMEYRYGIEVGDDKIREAKDNNKMQLIKNKKDQEIVNEVKEGDTKFVRITIRSGQVVEYAGNVVILGDVNPGGVVISGGNIIVLGSLRGVAIAGKRNNKEAIVSAYNLQPTQLRIGNIISRSPDNETSTTIGPEIASIKDDVMVIESL